MLVTQVLDQVVEVLDRIAIASPNNQLVIKLRDRVKSFRQDVEKLYEFLEKEKAIKQEIHELLRKKEKEYIRIAIYGNFIDDHLLIEKKMKEKRKEFSKHARFYNNVFVKMAIKRLTGMLKDSGKAAEATLQDGRKWEEAEHDRRQQRDRRRPLIFSLINNVQASFQHHMMKIAILAIKLTHENLEQASRFGINTIRELAYYQKLDKELKLYRYEMLIAGCGFQKLLPNQVAAIEATGAIEAAVALSIFQTAGAIQAAGASLLEAATNLISS